MVYKLYENSHKTDQKIENCVQIISADDFESEKVKVTDCQILKKSVIQSQNVHLYFFTLIVRFIFSGSLETMRAQEAYPHPGTSFST